MQWSAQRKIQAGFWLLSFVPFLLCYMAYRSVSSLVEDLRLVAQTNTAIHRLENLQSRIKDIEVAQREFLLTGDERLLKPYYSNRDQLLKEIQDLSKLGQQKMWTSHLESLVPENFEKMDHAIGQRRKGGIEFTQNLIMYDGLPPAMENMRRVFRNMIQEEQRRLAQRTEDQRAQMARTIAIFIAVLVLNIAFIWTLAWFLRGEDRRMRELNAELEQRVAQRTEALQRSNEDLQQFAYVASHDLQEPLRAVASYTTLIQRKYAGQLDDEADQYITFITDGVRRMGTLIKDLLDYSRAGETPEENLQPVDTDAVLKTVLSNLKVTISESRAKVTYDRLPPVTADPMRLTQILQNLIGNALKYHGQRDPVVHIRAESNQWETRFAVIDNGIGIDPKHLHAVFGIFKRLHGKEYEGTGIGLAMCKKIVERMGGRIWVESRPGEGSTFFFTIPKRRELIATAS